MRLSDADGNRASATDVFGMAKNDHENIEGELDWGKGDPLIRASIALWIDLPLIKFENTFRYKRVTRLSTKTVFLPLLFVAISTSDWDFDVDVFRW